MLLVQIRPHRHPNGDTVRVEPVDSLRGLAACVVAFIFHLHLFGSADADAWFLQIQPLKWLHEFGALGVDLFFVLSGFVFALKYAKPIGSGVVTAYDFFVLRFSRLYPLHVATLLAAATILWFQFLRYPVMPGDKIQIDTYHLFLNLTLTQNLGFQNGFSFNTPAWSLSLEALCYVLFFLLVFSSPRFFVAGCIAMVAFGAAMEKLALNWPLLNFPVGQATTGFFCGCLVACAYQSRHVGWMRWATLGILGYFAFNAVMAGSIFGAALPYFYLTFDLIVFPCLLLCVLTFKPARSVLETRPLRFLGLISYSIYLLHLPVALIIQCVFRELGSAVPITSLAFIFSYVAIVIGLATLVYYKFELPAQRSIRAKLLRDRTPPSVVPLRDAASGVAEPEVVTAAR